MVAQSDSPIFRESKHTPEFRARVEALWDEGITTAEMGRRLGITKNAVIGLVHKMGLDTRRAPAPLSRRPTLPIPAPSTCVWPIGHPHDPATFRWCGDPEVVPDKPYCATHCAIAYVPLRRTAAD